MPSSKYLGSSSTPCRQRKPVSLAPHLEVHTCSKLPPWPVDTDFVPFSFEYPLFQSHEADSSSFSGDQESRLRTAEHALGPMPEPSRRYQRDGSLWPRCGRRPWFLHCLTSPLSQSIEPHSIVSFVRSAC